MDPRLLATLISEDIRVNNGFIILEGTALIEAWKSYGVMQLAKAYGVPPEKVVRMIRKEMKEDPELDITDDVKADIEIMIHEFKKFVKRNESKIYGMAPGAMDGNIFGDLQKMFPDKDQRDIVLEIMERRDESGQRFSDLFIRRLLPQDAFVGPCKTCGGTGRVNGVQCVKCIDGRRVGWMSCDICQEKIGKIKGEGNELYCDLCIHGIRELGRDRRGALRGHSAREGDPAMADIGGADVVSKTAPSQLSVKGMVHVISGIVIFSLGDQGQNEEEEGDVEGDVEGDINVKNIMVKFTEGRFDPNLGGLIIEFTTGKEEGKRYRIKAAAAILDNIRLAVRCDQWQSGGPRKGDKFKIYKRSTGDAISFV